MSTDSDTQEDPPCHSRACAIQSCLAKNGYDDQKCQQEINALYDCCNRFYLKHGEDATSVSCPKASLLRVKMKQLANAK